ncbi:MAG: hypothetical protein QOK42_1870 [Frankiaceae bacterium]|jgi:hypothetical protein|nr:hypothetical protein [Frankiaceae bacterium]
MIASLRIVGVGASLVAALNVTGCTASRTSAGPAPGGSPSAAPTSSSTPAVTVEVAYAHGSVSPRGYTAKVKLGTKVHLVVHADVKDEVHVHGFDLHQEIIGGVAVIDFVANVPGTVEVELEAKSYLLLHIQVA